MVPCPAGKSLMSPAVGKFLSFFPKALINKKQKNNKIIAVSGMRMLTWSSCTRNMIDAEYDRREKKNQNCFYT